MLSTSPSPIQTFVIELFGQDLTFVPTIHTFAKSPDDPFVRTTVIKHSSHISFYVYCSVKCFCTGIHDRGIGIYLSFMTFGWLASYPWLPWLFHQARVLRPLPALPLLCQPRTITFTSVMVSSSLVGSLSSLKFSASILHGEAYALISVVLLSTSSSSPITVYSDHLQYVILFLFLTLQLLHPHPLLLPLLNHCIICRILLSSLSRLSPLFIMCMPTPRPPRQLWLIGWWSLSPLRNIISCHLTCTSSSAHVQAILQ